MNALADTWTSLTPTTCPTSSAGLFTTGQQYVDDNNGVLQNSWSMLVRWQDAVTTVGPTNWIGNPVNYDAGTYTTYTVPAPHALWQHGYQPESEAGATPAVQLHCFDAGMILDSWYTPHSGATVPGGEFNDMYGYAWASDYEPYAFKHLSGGNFWAPNDLVLQGLAAVPALQTFAGNYVNGNWTWTPTPDFNDLGNFNGSGQLDFFAYLEDTTHPDLHPIAILAQIFGNGPTFDCARNRNGVVDFDYAQGVWFGATGIGAAAICDTDISTMRYTGGYTTNSLSSALTFYRIHYTPQNWANLIARINARQCQPGVSNSCQDSHSPNCTVNGCPPCQPGVSCPQVGYSTDPNAYKLRYVGMIAETAPCYQGTKIKYGQPTSITHCSTNLLDASNPDYLPNKDGQIGMAAKISGVSAYAYSSN